MNKVHLLLLHAALKRRSLLQKTYARWLFNCCPESCLVGDFCQAPVRHIGGFFFPIGGWDQAPPSSAAPPLSSGFHRQREGDYFLPSMLWPLHEQVTWHQWGDHQKKVPNGPAESVWKDINRRSKQWTFLLHCCIQTTFPVTSSFTDHEIQDSQKNTRFWGWKRN